jgi:hypothetical protein
LSRGPRVWGVKGGVHLHVAVAVNVVDHAYDDVIDDVVGSRS